MQCEDVNAVADAIIDGIGEFGWLRPDTVLADQQGFRAEVDAQESRTGRAKSTSLCCAGAGGSGSVFSAQKPDDRAGISK
ncbi:hypothetical protein HZ326_5474 [Fusarium oxysporum f. sp. albedinis]|nr:hypothetical protein HZ326_5474 [Fusarium oxysporum f. sp. albedinis]KAK2476858.1 hypothetical protein H9L39_12082 [Fusarium oxysporum f. sp. albedinis]